VTNEITRLISAFARHPMHGVVAQLGELTKEQFGGIADSEPTPPKLYDDVDTEELVLELDPPAVPALVIWTDSDISLNLNRTDYLTPTETVIVAFAYITRDVPNVKAKLDGGYVLRAARRCLTRFNNQTYSRGYRKLNGVQILNIESVSLPPIAGGVGKSQLWGLLYAAVNVADTQP
jgi:hypothetical protein